MRTIVVPLDGSRLAEHALPFVSALAAAAGARVELLRIPFPGVLGQLDPVTGEFHRGIAAHDLAETYLERVAQSLAAQGLDVRPLVVDDDAGPAAAIARVARDRDAALVAMATHGRAGFGRWLHGSVAGDVLRRAGVPVLMLPAATQRRWPVPWRSGQKRDPPFQVLVPLDGSTLSLEALSPAADLAAAFGGRLVLAQAIEPPAAGLYRGSVREWLPDPRAQGAAAEHHLRRAGALPPPEVPTCVRVAIGPAGQVIVGLAEELRVDAIAMATHGRTGLARLVLGSVATGVMGHARVPLLMVRPSQLVRDARTAPDPPRLRMATRTIAR